MSFSPFQQAFADRLASPFVSEEVLDDLTDIVSIAMSVGYSDQSAFTRQFRRTFGISPGKYRV